MSVNTLFQRVHRLHQAANRPVREKSGPLFGAPAAGEPFFWPDFAPCCLHLSALKLPCWGGGINELFRGGASHNMLRNPILTLQEVFLVALGLSMWKPGPGETGPPLEPQGASGRLGSQGLLEKSLEPVTLRMALNTYPPALSGAISLQDAAFLQVVGIPP